jgi:hypothetical protein
MKKKKTRKVIIMTTTGALHHTGIHPGSTSQVKPKQKANRIRKAKKMGAAKKK